MQGDAPMEWLRSWKGLDMFSEGNLLRENTVAGVLCTLKVTQGKQSHTQLLKFHLLNLQITRHCRGTSN